jgi:predicted metalloendopeptidase
MLEIVNNIQEQFREVLQTVDWMDEVTRKHALEKAKAMSAHIAYPDELLDDKKIDEYYANVSGTRGFGDFSRCRFSAYCESFEVSRVYDECDAFHTASLLRET